MKRYILNLALALDKLVNAILLGHPDETLSRRSARAANAGVPGFRHFCRFLDWLIQKHHCFISDQPGDWGCELWAWSDNFSLPILNIPASGDETPPQGSV